MSYQQIHTNQIAVNWQDNAESRPQQTWEAMNKNTEINDQTL